MFPARVLLVSFCVLWLLAGTPGWAAPSPGPGGRSAPGEPGIQNIGVHLGEATWRFADLSGYVTENLAVAGGGLVLASDASGTVHSPHGTVTTRALRPENLTRWLSLEADYSAPDGCTVVFSVSMDGGATWDQVPDDGNLSLLPLGDSAIQVRSELGTADLASTPVLRSVLLDFVFNRPPVIVSIVPLYGPTIYKRTTSVLSATVADPDGDSEIRYSWSLGGSRECALGATDRPTLSIMPYESGDYPFRLVVQDDFGGSAAANITVTAVSHPPSIDLAIDGTPYKMTPVHIYATTFSSDAELADYTWNLVSGPPFATLVQPTKPDIIVQSFFAGNCTVSLTVTEPDGASSTRSLTFTFIGHPPTAKLAADRQSAHAGMPFTFDASGSSDPDRDRLLYRFDFGDGEGTEWQEWTDAQHTYDRSGYYTVKLFARDIDGLVSDAQLNVLVRSPNFPPTVSIQMKEGNLTTPFDFVSRAQDRDGKVVSEEWEFGDGGSAEGDAVQHSYDRPGNYTVRVWVNDDDGAVGTASVVVNLNRAPLVLFGNPPGDIEMRPDQAMTLSVLAADPDGDPLAYSWVLDDAPISWETNSSYKFEQDKGDHRVTVTVDDGRGGTANHTWRMNVVQRPVQSSPQYFFLALLIAAVLAIQLAYLSRESLRGLWRSRGRTNGAGPAPAGSVPVVLAGEPIPEEALPVPPGATPPEDVNPDPSPSPPSEEVPPGPPLFPPPEWG